DRLTAERREGIGHVASVKRLRPGCGRLGIREFGAPPLLRAFCGVGQAGEPVRHVDSTFARSFHPIDERVALLGHRVDGERNGVTRISATSIVKTNAADTLRRRANGPPMGPDTSGTSGLGFSHATLEELHGKLVKLKTSKSPFPAKVKDKQSQAGLGRPWLPK